MLMVIDLTAPLTLHLAVLLYLQPFLELRNMNIAIFKIAELKYGETTTALAALELRKVRRVIEEVLVCGI